MQSAPGAGDAAAARRALADTIADRELVARSRRGDEAAWEVLARRYQQLVVTVARSHGLNEEDALDVVGNVFAELWRSLSQLDRPGQVRAWLVTVARRHSLAQSRDQRRWVNLAEWEDSGNGLHDRSKRGDVLLLEAEREQAMRVALARLSPRCRRLLDWLFFSDPPPDYEEIGRRLGIAGNSIGFIRGRCLRKLRQTLEAELSSHDPGLEETE